MKVRKMTEKTCLFLRCQRDHHPKALAEAPAGLVETRHQWDLDQVDLDRHGAILVSMLTDQHSLARHSARLEAFLDRGGILVFNGHVAHPPIAGLRPFVGVRGHGVDILTLHRLADHPVFDGVDAHDLTYRRGVAGFYARGHNPPPEGAVALNGIGPDKAAADWIWRRPGGGTVLMHAGLDLWAYVADPTSAARMAPQLLGWLRSEMRGDN